MTLTSIGEAWTTSFKPAYERHGDRGVLNVKSSSCIDHQGIIGIQKNARCCQMKGLPDCWAVNEVG